MMDQEYINLDLTLEFTDQDQDLAQESTSQVHQGLPIKLDHQSLELEEPQELQEFQDPQALQEPQELTNQPLTSPTKEIIATRAVPIGVEVAVEVESDSHRALFRDQAQSKDRALLKAAISREALRATPRAAPTVTEAIEDDLVN